MLASTVPRSIGRVTICGYVGRFSATWSTGLRKGPAHLCDITCFSAARHWRLTISTLRFAATAANAAESKGGGAPPFLATRPGALSRTDRPARCVRLRVSASSASSAAVSHKSLSSSLSAAERTASAETRSMEHESSANLRLALSRCSRSWCFRAASCAGVSSRRVSLADRSCSARIAVCFNRAAACACAFCTIALTTGSCSGSNENAGRLIGGADALRLSPVDIRAIDTTPPPTSGRNWHTFAPTQHAHVATAPIPPLSGMDGTKLGVDSMRTIGFGPRARAPCCLWIEEKGEKGDWSVTGREGVRRSGGKAIRPRSGNRARRERAIEISRVALEKTYL